MSRLGPAALLGLSCLIASVLAHEHDDSEVDNALPISSGIYVHGSIQTVSWLVLFPLGMVLGLVRSRWHVPVQVAATALSIVGYVLGHHHGGRTYYSSVHVPMASFLAFYLFSQFSIGVFLKMHIYQESTMRKHLVTAHGLIGRTFPVVGYIQVVFGIITALGFCRGGHLGQCLAHYIMGSSFIAYGTLLILVTLYGISWLRKRGVSQEYIDSWALLGWGIINTFTEHGFLEPAVNGWSHKDMQHTAMGVVWVAGGALGIFLARNGKRNVLPAIIFGLTGYAMSGHAQPTMIATHTHVLFGWLLEGVAIVRIVEICFITKGEYETPDGVVSPFQHLGPMLLVISGVCFMAAHEEQLQWIDALSIDHITYTLIIFSLGFLCYLHACVLMHIWSISGRNAPPPSPSAQTKPSWSWRSLLGNKVKSNKKRPFEPTANGYAAVAPNVDDEDLELDDATDAYWAQRPERV